MLIRGNKPLRAALIAIVVMLVIAIAGFVVWTRIARYPAFPEATALAEAATTPQGWYVFEPPQPADTGFVFYPGGLVDPAAYAPLAKRVSDGGVIAVIVPMPLDLAVFGQGRAEDVIAAYPGVKHWVIGGHSLGGAMSAEFVKGNPAAVDAIAFLAAYPADTTDLSALPIVATSIYGTKDGVAGDVFDESMQLLPPSAVQVVIDGGNHAQFGDYGPQKGDGTAGVSREEQQRQAADGILALAYGIER